MDLGIAGKKAIVCAASKGLGKGCALALAKNGVELVITGRGADEKVMEMADLVTEMKEIKHYYHKGVQARIGIEK